jgi:copper transport protein
MYRRVRALTVPGLLALATLLVGPGPAAAHALLIASDPGAGASLASAPAAVTLTFSEEPDPRLSQIRVLDSSGADVSSGEVAVVPGEPSQLRAPLEPLKPGVYTVAWRTVSAVDGHLATGSFAFAVGTPLPSGGTLTPSQSATAGS